MKYKNRYTGKIVTVIKEDEDGYVYFRLNGIEQIVAAKRFHKVYEKVEVEFS